MSWLSLLQTSVTSTISAAVPSAVVCAAHPGKFRIEDIARLGLNASADPVQLPAILVSVLRSKPARDVGNGQTELWVRMAATVLVALDAPLGALPMVETIAAMVPQALWGVEQPDPLNVDGGILPALPSVKVKALHRGDYAAQGVSPTVVLWWQPVRFGRDLWHDEGSLPGTVYLSRSPNTGLAHQAAYEVVATAPPDEAAG